MSRSLIRSGSQCVGGTAGSSKGIAEGSGRTRGQPERVRVRGAVFQKRFAPKSEQQAKRDDDQKEDEGKQLADDVVSQPRLERLKTSSPTLKRVGHQHASGEGESHGGEAPSWLRRNPSLSRGQPQERKGGHQRRAGFKAFGE